MSTSPHGQEQGQDHFQTRVHGPERRGEIRSPPEVEGHDRLPRGQDVREAEGARRGRRENRIQDLPHQADELREVRRHGRAGPGIRDKRGRGRGS